MAPLPTDQPAQPRVPARPAGPAWAGLLALLAAALVVAPGAPGVDAATAAPPPRGDSGIEVIEREWLDRRTLDLTVSTAALAEPAGVRVLVPRRYRARPRLRYPVLYLLHGGFGGYTDWTTAGDAARLTARRRLIVVMPDGGRGGWYRDWDNFGEGGPPEWETFHIEQLVPWIDRRFRTLGSRRGRAIAGLSMGGFGSLSYAARHPRLFAAAAAFSGAVDTRDAALRELIRVSPLIDGGSPGAIYPPPETGEADWHAHNPWSLARRLSRMHVALYTGDGEPGPFDDPGAPLDVQESIVDSMNVAVHERLRELGIEHRWRQFHGTHTWPYWQRDLRRELPSLLAALGDPRPLRAPARRAAAGG